MRALAYFLQFPRDCDHLQHEVFSNSLQGAVLIYSSSPFTAENLTMKYRMMKGRLGIM